LKIKSKIINSSSFLIAFLSIFRVQVLTSCQKVEKATKRNMRILAALSFFFLLTVGVVAAKEPYTVPGEVVVFDVWKYFEEEGIYTIYERADALYFITSLQGIVNRNEFFHFYEFFI